MEEDYAIKYPDRNDILSLQAKNVAEGMISATTFVSRFLSDKSRWIKDGEL